MYESTIITKPKRILTLLTGLFIISAIGLTIPVDGYACHKVDSNGAPIPHGKNNTCSPPPDGEGDPDAPSSYNLARASFTNFAGSGLGGISADGLASCTVSRPVGTSPVTYDYWAWQEGLLSDAENIHIQDPSDDCKVYENRSDVSGGGRWFLITTAGPDILHEVQRWLVFDFSSSPDEYNSPCPNLDGDPDPTTNGIYKTDLNQEEQSPCVDHLTVRLPADRILKSNASTQKLDISIRHQPDGSDYWPPWGSVQYKEPLHIRKPSDDVGAPFAGRDCTVMSTRPAWNSPTHDRMEAELYNWTGPSSGEYIGTYNMPLEVCVIRTSD